MTKKEGIFWLQNRVYVLVRAAAFEVEGTFGLGLEGVAVLGSYGVDAEVPDAKVDLLFGDDFHEGVLAEVERLAGSDLHPVAAGEEFSGGLDDVLLTADPAEHVDAKAGDDAGVDANVGADDDVAAIGGAADGSAGSVAGGSVGVDGEGGTAGGRRIEVADAKVEDGGVDMELDGGLFALELDDLVGTGERIDSGAKDVVGGVAVEVTLGLGEGDELGCAVEGVEDESAVFFGEAEVGCDLGGEGGAIGLLFVAGLPFFGGVEIDERCGNLFFGAAALGADVTDDVAGDPVAHDDLVAAVLEDEAGTVGRGGGIGRHKWPLLRGLGGQGKGRGEEKYDLGKLCAHLIRLTYRATYCGWPAFAPVWILVPAKEFRRIVCRNRLGAVAGVFRVLDAFAADAGFAPWR